MKKATLIVSCLFVMSTISAQQTADNDKVEMIKLVHFGVSKPLSEIATITTEEIDAPANEEESKDREGRVAQKYMFTGKKDGAAYATDPSSIQRTQGNRALRGPIVNWQGQTGGGCPPDPTGAAGPNHYIQSVNATPVKIYSKTGTTMLTITSMGSLWSPATGNMGDPIVMYDKYADRFFISQFGQSGSTNYVYIAVSSTSDPLGTWNTYTYSPSTFPDYLKFSIWWDGYYMTANFGGKIMVFERDKMILGQAARGFTKTYAPSNPGGFFCPMPASADGGLPAVGTPLPVFQYTDDGWGGTYTDAVKIFNFTVNWTPVTPTATVAAAITVPTAAFDASYDPNWDDIWTPGSTGKLDGIGGVIHYRIQWRKWAGYNTAVMSWGVIVDANSGLRSIKWVELRQNQSTGVWSLYQEGVYAPADGANRWMEGISMDDNGSIALAYCIAASTAAGQGAAANISPGLRYTGRLATDPLGTMTFAEAVAINGSGTGICGGSNRWGDYAQVTLDPDGQTFWYTGDYAVTGTRTRIYSFKLPLPTGIEELANEAQINVSVTGGNLVVNASNLGSNEETLVDMFDITGRQVASKKVVPSSNSLEASFDISSLSQGTYFVRVARVNTSFQKISKIVITK
jgi:hypothetical protein